MNVYKLNSELAQTGGSIVTSGTKELTVPVGTLMLVSSAGDATFVTNNSADNAALGAVALKDNSVLIESTGHKIRIRLVDQITAGKTAYVAIARVEASSILTSFKK